MYIVETPRGSKYLLILTACAMHAAQIDLLTSGGGARLAGLSCFLFLSSPQPVYYDIVVLCVWCVFALPV